MNQAALLFPDFTDPRSLDASDESDGWYTPSWLLDDVRRMLGAIDCDPATCEAAQAVVQAKTWYTQHENGLLQQWAGRLYLNPPYSAPTPWIKKALMHYQDGDVSAALILTNSYTETGWWQLLAEHGTMLMFRGRLNFWHPAKTATQNRTGQTLCYLGQDGEKFRLIFSKYGVIR